MAGWTKVGGGNKKITTCWIPPPKRMDTFNMDEASKEKSRTEGTGEVL